MKEKRKGGSVRRTRAGSALKRQRRERKRKKGENEREKNSVSAYQGHPPRVRGPEPLDPSPAQHGGPPTAPADAAEGAVDKLKEKRGFGGVVGVF